MDNKLTRIDHPSATVQQFSYDGDGVRRSAAKDGVVTYFLYDSNGLRVLAELDANGTTTARQTYGDGLVSEWRGGAHRWPLYNALGTTTSLTDASQTVTDTYVLDAYGNPVAKTGETATPYKYVGRLSYNTDPTSGMLLLGARWYDPTLGRFISEDPGRDGGNWYEYATSGPTTAVDPTGETPWVCLTACACAGIGGGYAAAGCYDGCRTAVNPGECWRQCLADVARDTDWRVRMTEACMAGCAACMARFMPRDPSKPPRNLSEQLAMQEARGKGVRIMEGRIRDPRYPEDVWAKMQHIHEPLNPVTEKIEVHYWKCVQTGQCEGLKIKEDLRPPRNALGCRESAAGRRMARGGRYVCHPERFFWGVPLPLRWCPASSPSPARSPHCWPDDSLRPRKVLARHSVPGDYPGPCKSKENAK